MSTPPSPPNSFGDSLLCPVCFIMFEGRIIQCSQGHSVCEKCHCQLHNECPQCRSHFVGTRNYLLEDIVKQLKQLKQYACANDSENGNAEQKMNDAIAKFVNSIPKPSEAEPVAVNPPNLDSSGDTMDNITIILPPPILITLPGQVESSRQPAGLFQCRMIQCEQKLPICRLLNHIRYFHKEKLTETRLPVNDPEFVMHWTFPCASYRHAIQISKFGLFFFIVNVKKEAQKTIADAWVQCVCPNGDARKYTFHVGLRMGNQIATFTDYVYGSSSDAAYIQDNKQCLHLESSRKAKKLKEIAVDVKIMKTNRATNNRRTNVTNISTIVP